MCHLSPFLAPVSIPPLSRALWGDPSSIARGGTHKDRKDLYRLIDTDYYGYRDDEDGALVPSESIAERQGMLTTFDPFFSLLPFLPILLTLSRE